MADAQTPVPCDSCDDEVPGEHYCIDCQQTLCSQCEKFHKKFTKNHKVVLRSQVGEVDISILNCTDHGDQASVHCEKCNIPICIRCVTEKHKGHKMTNLNKIFEERKQIIQRHLNEIQQDILPNLEGRRDHIESEKKKYEAKFQQVTKDMEAGNQALRRQIDKHLSDRGKDLSVIRHSDLLVFDGYTREVKTKLKLIKGRKSEYQDVLQKNSLSAVINFVPKRHPLSSQVGRLELPKPPSFLPGSIQIIGENVLQLHLSTFSGSGKPLKQTSPSIISTFKSPLKGDPSICFAEGSNMWLGGNDSREIVMVDKKGNVIEKRKIKNRTNALAAMNSTDIIISPHSDDSSSVCIVQASGREYLVFDASPSSSRGISVTADKNLLICTSEGKLVRTSILGTNMKQLYKGSDIGSVRYAVENTDGNIYISDFDAKQIVIVNSNGTVLSKLTHTTDNMKLKIPRGLVKDKMGNILFADGGNNCIYIIDQNQDMRMLVGPLQGITSPRQLAVDIEDNLWIAQLNCVINVVKYLA